MSTLSSNSFESNRSADHFNKMTIEVGHAIISPMGETIETSGDFQSNKFAVETLVAIIKDLRLHSVMKLTKDSFKGLTIQFSDHYYKIDLSADNAEVHKYKLHNNLHTSSVMA